MMPTEVAVAVAVVPELVRGIDGWGTPLEPAPGVGIRPIPVVVEPVSVALGSNEPRPLVIPPTMEPSRSPEVVEVGLAVGDTVGTLTAMVEDPVGAVVDSTAGIEMPRLSRRLPWEEVVAAVVEALGLVALAMVLELVAVPPRRFETSEPT